MRDGRLALGAEDLHVQMRQATRDGQSHPKAAGRVEGAKLKIIVQGAHFVEVSNEPQLSTRVPGSHVGGDEA